jgi:hypothetical protein
MMHMQDPRDVDNELTLSSPVSAGPKEDDEERN